MTVLKQKRMWEVALAVMLMVLMGAGGALCGKIQAFTADNVRLGPDGRVKSVTKLYFASNKMRSDMDIGAKRTGKDKMVLIYRRDKKELWALNPEKKVYVQMPLDEKKWEQEAKGMVKSENAKILGKETVNGYRCVKKQVTRKIEMMGMKMTTKQTIWVSDKLEIPIRTRRQSGEVTELRNIKAGKPPAKVFEIPPGYKKIGDNIGTLMMTMHGMRSGEMPSAAQQSEGQGKMKLPFKLPKGLKLPFGSSN